MCSGPEHRASLRLCGAVGLLVGRLQGLTDVRAAHFSLLFLLPWFLMYCNFSYLVLAGSREQSD